MEAEGGSEIPGGGAGDQEQERLEYTGDAGMLFPIFLVNLLLSIVTLGLFRFWARTRIRRYMWDNLRFRGESFEYTGTGKELFFGFLIVLLVVFVPLIGLGFVAYWLETQGQSALATALIVFIYIAYFFLFGVAIYRARRYRLGRTMWRGIRMAQSGSSVKYSGIFILFAILNVITLGWTAPLGQTALYAMETDNSWFGSARFRFTGSSRPIYKSFAIAWVLLLPTLGLSYLWYVATRMRYFASQTEVEDFEFSFSADGLELLWFLMVNFLIQIATLGLATPFIQQRTVRFVARHLTFEGGHNLDDILQNIEESPRFGEGLAEAFDLGSI